jgi:hypothetical protein
MKRLMTKLIQPLPNQEKTSCAKDSLWNTLVVAISGRLKKTLGVVTVTIPSIQKGKKLCLKSGFPKVNSSGNVFSSFVKAVNVFCGLEKYDYSAPDKISLWSVATVVICCFRGMTALALTAHGKRLGFAINYDKRR